MSAELSEEGQCLESLVARVADEFLERQKRGERPEVEEYATRHPEAAELLRKVLASLRLLGLSQSAGLTPGHVSPEEPGLGVLGDYRILREVGRGGMGVVYEAEQISLDRRVALKMLPFAATLDERQLQRFHNEARAAASLDHPHIVPVIAVGCERGVHFYAMRFIDGQPLSALLMPRPHTAETVALRKAPPEAAEAKPPVDGPQLPAVAVSTVVGARSTLPVRGGKEWYRAVAQLGVEAAGALAYAHERGLIHRDIKPGNLLVDAQGKLYVTDFGLARTADTRLTLTGDLLGTLRYMSPEQALGKHDLIDHRTDIYALGATLYELLTGSPAVEGRDRQEILQKIATEEPRPLRRHERTIPRDLETVVLKALEKEPLARYATAQELAADLSRFLGDEPVRARPPGLGERIAKWSRRHRALVWSATAGLLMALTALAGSLGWVLRDSAARQAEVEGVVREAVVEAESLAKQKKWPQALQVAEWTAGLQGGRPVAEQLGRRVQRVLADTRMVAKLERVYLTRPNVAAEIDSGYRAAFAWYGLDPEHLDPEQAGREIRARVIRGELVAALDDWAFFRKELGGGAAGRKHLLAVIRAADPDGWRNQIRDASERNDVDALQKLAALMRPEREPEPTAALLLAAALKQSGQSEEAVALLRQTQRQHPTNLVANLHLAVFLHELSPTRPDHLDEAIGFYRVAVALRPENAMVHNNLGAALSAKGRLADAIVAFRRAISLQEDYYPAHHNLGNALHRQGQLPEATAAFRQALRIKSDYADAIVGLGNVQQDSGQLDEAIDTFREAIRQKKDYRLAHHCLGNALREKGQLEEAIRAYREAIRLKGDDALPYNDLGVALVRKGRLDEAIRAFQKAISLKKDDAKAHNNLGFSLHQQGQLIEAIAALRQAVALQSDYANAYLNLGNVLQDKGQLDEAIAAFRQAIGAQPDYQPALFNLGNALRQKGQVDEAIAVYRKAIHLRPGDALAHGNLGIALDQLGHVDEAIAEHRKAIALNKNSAAAHYNLGNALRQKGQVDQAIAAYREAIRVKNDHALAHCLLGKALKEKGKFAEALTCLRRGHELGSRNPRWRHPSALWIRECERLADLDVSLPAILRGEKQPADADESIFCAWLCQRHRGLNVAAARFYRQAFASKPALATASPGRHRYNAVCAAALAGTGQGKDANMLGPREQASWRRQALEWLRAEFAHWARQLEGKAVQSRQAAEQALQHWLRDPDLAGLRGASSLAQLPQVEREPWRALWSEVNQALARAHGKVTSEIE